MNRQAEEKLYGFTIAGHRDGARYKGTLAPGRAIFMRATSAARAYEYLCAQYRPDDERPIRAKGLVRSCLVRKPQLGDRVELLPGKGYQRSEERPQGYTRGIVAEVLHGHLVSICFPGHYTGHVDTFTGDIASFTPATPESRLELQEALEAMEQRRWRAQLQQEQQQRLAGAA